MDSNLENFKINTAFNNISAVIHNNQLKLHSSDNTLQSAIDLSIPHRLALKNLEFLVAILLFMPTPKRILILGTAAGSLLQFFRQHYPQTEISSLDIDSEMIELLLEKKILPEADDKLIYILDDAKHFIQHSQQQYDLILVDIFSGNQSPGWLLEKPSIDQLFRLLSEYGAISFNLLIDSEHSFNRFYRNLRLVFNKQTLCMPVEGFENTIAYGFHAQMPVREMSWYMQRTLELSQSHAIDYMEVLSAIYTTNPAGHGVI
jgi:spermidine synthase